jgi:hypothetical protein
VLKKRGTSSFSLYVNKENGVITYMIDKITNNTQVRYWIDRINKIIDKINVMNYSWDAESIEGTLQYEFPTPAYEPMPEGEYVVYYSGIELHPDDYTVNSNTLTFAEAPKESGCSIRVRFLK